jgi:hypothetical protein
MLMNAGKKPKIFTSEQLEDAKFDLYDKMEKLFKEAASNRGDRDTAELALHNIRATLEDYFTLLGLSDHASYYE